MSNVSESSRLDAVYKSTINCLNVSCSYCMFFNLTMNRLMEQFNVRSGSLLHEEDDFDPHFWGMNLFSTPLITRITRTLLLSSRRDFDKPLRGEESPVGSTVSLLPLTAAPCSGDFTPGFCFVAYRAPCSNHESSTRRRRGEICGF